MRKQVYDYFVNLENENLERYNGSILVTPKNMKKVFETDYSLEVYDINKNTFYLKWVGDLYDNLQPLASSKLFNNLGIISPPMDLSYKLDYNEYYQTTQDIISVEKFDSCKQPSHISRYNSIQPYSSHNFTTDKWKIITDNSLRNYFLTFMTEDCLEELINMTLIDELRSESDRNMHNFFLYKEKGSDKYNGVVVLDFDLVEILADDNTTRNSFEYFLKSPYDTTTPHLAYDHKNYKTRIEDIRNLLHKGLLSNNNISIIKDTLNYDFPKEIENQGIKYHTQKSQIEKIKTPISFLWEYNRETIGKDLGL